MNVLIVSLFFAPFSGVGALRMTSLAEYLISYGENVTVVKAENKNYSAITKEAPLSQMTYECVDIDFSDKKSINPIVYNKLKELLLKNHFDCMIATFGPYDHMDAIIRIKKEYEIPLIVDYRDLWIFDPRPIVGIRSKLAYSFDRFKNYPLELKLMKYCDKFITISPQSLSTMKKHYRCLENKSECIFNGYSRVELKLIEKDDSFVEICALGKFAYYSNEGAEGLLYAVKLLYEEGYKVRIIHVGTEEKQIDEIKDKISLPSECYKDIGQKSYIEAMNIAYNTNACVAIINYAEGLGTKVFDYVFLNKPIIAIAPNDSEFERLLEPAENVFVCRGYKDAYDALKQIVEKGIKDLTSNTAFRNSFDREYQNEKYYCELKKVLNGNN